MHRLRCFGRAAIEDPSGNEVRLRSQKHLALLLYLANERDKRHSRERLSSLFWGTEPRLARHSLSQALYDITQNLPSLELHRSVREVGLGDDGMAYDAESFTEAVREEKLDDAVELYRGPFAPDLEEAGGEDFERWIEEERHRYRRLAETALLRHMSRCDDQARWGEMCFSATRLISMNPLNEEAHRAYMRALWLQGNQEAAISHYEAEHERLERELPGGLSEETRDLVRRIRGSRPALASSAVHETQRLPMIGREEEFGELKRLLAETVSGEGRLAIVHGEAGMGKTRLLEEFHEFAALEGARVLESRCYSAETDVPFGPVVDGLDEIAAELAASAGSDANYFQLGHLFPDIFEATAPKLDSFLGAGAGRRRLYEEVADLLRRSCTEQPIVWLIDDAHWMDASSTSLVHYLVRRLGEHPVMIVCTARQGASELESGITSVYQDQDLASRSKLVRLSPLSASASRNLVRHVFGSDEVGSERLADRLYSLSGGTPYFLVELLRSAREIGEVDDSNALADQVGSWRLSDDAKSLIRNRLSGLTADSIRLLEIAAVAGKHASLDIFEDVTGLSREKIADDARSLYESNIIEDVNGAVAFSHDVVREYVYQAMGYLQRSALHAAVGEVLGRMTSRVQAASLAFHFEQAGDAERAYEYAIRAAEAAVERHAYHEGESLSQMALRCATGDQQRLKARRNSAYARFGAGNFEAAASDLEEITGSENLAPIERVRLRLLRAQTLLELARWKEAVAEASAAETDLDALHAPQRAALTVELLQIRVKLGMRWPKQEIVADAAARLQSLLESGKLAAVGASIAAKALCNLAVYQMFFASLKEAWQSVTELSELSDKLDQDAKLKASIVSGMVGVRQGMWDSALESLQHGYELATESRDVRYQLVALNNMSACYVTLGQWNKVADCYSKAQDLFGILPDEIYLSIPTAINFADSLFYQNRTREARSHYVTVLEKSRRLGGTDNEPSIKASLALCELRLGNREEAERIRDGLLSDSGELEIESVGSQNVFKVVWLDGALRWLSSDCEASELLLAAARFHASREYAEALHLEWLADLFVDSNHTASKEDRTRSMAGEVGTKHKTSNLGWFLYFARRWKQLVRQANRSIPVTAQA